MTLPHFTLNAGPGELFHTVLSLQDTCPFLGICRDKIYSFFKTQLILETPLLIFWWNLAASPLHKFLLQNLSLWYSHWTTGLFFPLDFNLIMTGTRFFWYRQCFTQDQACSGHSKNIFWMNDQILSGHPILLQTSCWKESGKQPFHIIP